MHFVQVLSVALGFRTMACHIAPTARGHLLHLLALSHDYACLQVLAAVDQDQIMDKREFATFQL